MTGWPGYKLKYMKVKKVIPCCIFSKNRQSFSILLGLGVLQILYIGKKSLKLTDIWMVDGCEEDS